MCSFFRESQLELFLRHRKINYIFSKTLYMATAEDVKQRAVDIKLRSINQKEQTVVL